MRYLTDRKRAEGLGASGSGTHHHWQMMVSSIFLVPLVPLFIFTFGYGLGGTHEEVLAYFGRPFPALVMALSLIVITLHMMHEAKAAIEDYMHGVAGKLTLIFATAFYYTLIAAGLFAIARIAL